MSNAAKAAAVQEAMIGAEAEVSPWFEIGQDRINDFADVTLDHQFIHIDPEAAAQTPFGGTIAHGFLTLSMLVHLDATIERDAVIPEGILMGVNYGFDKVRFLSPVPSGSKVRLHSEVATVAVKGSNVDITRKMTVELEGSEKPALVAEWISRMVFDS